MTEVGNLILWLDVHFSGLFALILVFGRIFLFLGSACFNFYQVWKAQMMGNQLLTEERVRNWDQMLKQELTEDLTLCQELTSSVTSSKAPKSVQNVRKSRRMLATSGITRT